MKANGWREVFAFTFIQQIKTKSFIIGTVVITLIVALIAFMANFLPTLFIGDNAINGGANDDSGPMIDNLYIANETGYEFDMQGIAQTLKFDLHEISAEEVQAKTDAIAGSTERTVVSRIYIENDMLAVDSRYSPEVGKGDCQSLTLMLSSEVRTQFLLLSGVPEDKILTAVAGVQTTISCAGEEPVGMIQEIMNSVVPMLSAIVLFIFIFSYSQLVAQAIAIEKSSRIVEYLLTSIKPLALIVGKVLAMCAVSLMQFLIIIAGGAVGLLASMPFGIISKFGDLAAAASAQMPAGAGSADFNVQSIIADVGKAFSNVDVTMFIIMILTFILGFLLFAGIAGLAGASVSKMEDLGPAIQPLSIIGVLGFYLAYFPQITGEENTMSMLARYIPISSPFIMPSDYMLGKIGVTEAFISIAILLVCDVLIMVLVAKVYENIILHTGSRLKLGDMLKMSK